MVDYLTGITKSELVRLRHMSVRGIPMPFNRAPHLYTPKDDCSCKVYYFYSVLALFPALQLDKLTVYDPYHGEGVSEDVYGHWGTYREIDLLVKIAKGFKELVFISENDRCLNSNYLGGKVAAQPSTWDKMVKDRDGVNSGAGVEMFTFAKGQRAKMVGDHPFYHLRHDGRVVVADDNRDGDDAIPWDNKLHGGEEHSENVDRWLEVIEGGVELRVRRGNDADYVQDGKSLDEMYAISAQLSWKEIKEQGLFVLRVENDPVPWA